MYFSERLDMFSQFFAECLCSKVLIALLLGKPSPVCVLQCGALHHGITSISQEREEKGKINYLSQRPGGYLWANDISIRSEHAKGTSSFWIFLSSDCLICHILKAQTRKLFNINGFYDRIMYSSFMC